MNELRNAFLQALAVNEDDLKVRLGYADWLDEQGEHEEADRQRKWPAAKQWLLAFCQEHNPPPASEVKPLTYERLIDLGRAAVADPYDDGELWIGCDDNERMCYALRENAQAFWTNWSILTGVPVPSDAATKSSFSCGC